MIPRASLILSLVPIALWSATPGLPVEPGRGVHIQATQPIGEARIALVIGNSAYRDAPLRNPVNDARSVAEALRGCGFAVTELRDASRNQIREALRGFGSRIAEGGVGLFYFAGHGMQVKGRNFLIPVGADIAMEDEVAGEAIELDAILAKMDTARNRMNIVILDACRNNPFGRSFRGSQQGLAQVDAPTGTFVAFATAPGRTAADGSGSHGIYTAALLTQLQAPGLKLEDVFKRTRAEVLRASGQQQTPWENSSIVGDFYFVPGAVIPEASTPAPATRPKGYAGLQIRALPPELEQKLGAEGGALVVSVKPESPAARADVRQGDVITFVNGVKVTGPQDLAQVIGSQVPGSTVRLLLRRGGELGRVMVQMVLGTPPPDAQEALRLPGAELTGLQMSMLGMLNPDFARTMSKEDAAKAWEAIRQKLAEARAKGSDADLDFLVGFVEARIASSRQGSGSARGWREEFAELRALAILQGNVEGDPGMQEALDIQHCQSFWQNLKQRLDRGPGNPESRGREYDRLAVRILDRQHYWLNRAAEQSRRGDAPRP